MSVDVVIPTWNAGRTLERTLASLEGDHSFPRGRVILVDRASTDATCDIAKRHGCEVVTDTKGLGSARLAGLRAASTEDVLFIDSDIEAYDGFFADLTLGAPAGWGALQALCRSSGLPEAWERRRLAATFAPGQRHRPLAPGERALTLATLVKRELVTDAPIADLNVYEDVALAETVARKGRTWYVANVLAFHDRPAGEAVARAKWAGASQRRMGRPVTGVLRGVLGLPLRRRELKRIAPDCWREVYAYEAAVNRAMLVGWLRPGRYYHWKRPEG